MLYKKSAGWSTILWGVTETILATLCTSQYLILTKWHSRGELEKISQIFSLICVSHRSITDLPGLLVHTYYSPAEEAHAVEIQQNSLDTYIPGGRLILPPEFFHLWHLICSTAATDLPLGMVPSSSWWILNIIFQSRWTTGWEWKPLVAASCTAFGHPEGVWTNLWAERLVYTYDVVIEYVHVKRRCSCVYKIDRLVKDRRSLITAMNSLRHAEGGCSIISTFIFNWNGEAVHFDNYAKETMFSCFKTQLYHCWFTFAMAALLYIPHVLRQWFRHR